MVDQDQVKPLAPANERALSPTMVDQYAAGSLYRRHRRSVLCGGCCLSTLVIVGVVVLILALTVFKVKDPELTLNSITIDNLNVDPLTSNSLVSVNATLRTDVSIKNPNHASFRFGNSTTNFYYEGDTVGVAYAPSGKASAQKTLRMNVTVNVLIDQVASDSRLRRDLLNGSVNLTSYTELGGRVNVLGIVKKHIDIALNCSMTMDLSLTHQDINTNDCHARVH
ncbi:hypothetical protein QJS10_CPB22g00020 [Acorus calamus]|uniref:Late embryogenesis abundant protein LEA-2 subgroup domain-containing protein n=1 Tax=Acorus calamus TaxID=4465 RepID=A0AAV9BYV9_ACOCL|nr:hypothetical protein QJS10_CPB22g00020 [Acorus calamus]